MSLQDQTFADIQAQTKKGFERFTLNITRPEKLGIRLAETIDSVEVVEVFSSVANEEIQEKIKEEDRLVSINGTSIKTLYDAEIQMLQGSVGSPLTLVIERKMQAPKENSLEKVPDTAVATQTRKQPSKIPLPFMNEKIGLQGNWEEVGGNFLLRPPKDVQVKALIHFLGGSFVGAAPHLTYRYLLEGLAERGFLVVATPYNLSFDYLEICDSVCFRFEKAAIPLSKEYGALPVLGIGHSCGALLHLLITSLFPDTPRAGNALISFNNKQLTDAIPGFDSVVLPVVNSFVQPTKEALINKKPNFAVESLSFLRQNVRKALKLYADSPVSPAFVGNEILPLANQASQIVDQFPSLFQSIADGVREFTPSPDETKEVIRRMYRARRTLLVQFENDSLDETEDIKSVIAEAKQIYRMKRPMVTMDLGYIQVTGTHTTPLTQNIFLQTPLNGVDPVKTNFLETVEKTLSLLTEWLDEGL